MKMKMKIRALYLTGTALLIGAAGGGDSITFDASSARAMAGAWKLSRRRRRSCAGTAAS
jgi:hypothetical protein